MNRLILVRHAKTERRAASGDDFDRRLTERGRRDAALVAAALAKAGHRPDVVLLSPALRAVETWEILSDHFAEALVVEKASLYSAGPEELRALAGARPEASVMVVGHNPTIHLLALELAGGALDGPGRVGAGLSEGFPTAAAAVFDDMGGTPRLLAVTTPSDLGGGGDD